MIDSDLSHAELSTYWADISSHCSSFLPSLFPGMAVLRPVVWGCYTGAFFAASRYRISWYRNSTASTKTILHLLDLPFLVRGEQ